MSPQPKTARPVETLLAERELQQLWFSTLKRPWNTLVVMPTHAGGDAFDVANALAGVGRVHRGSAVRLIDARGAELGRAVSLISDMSSHALNGGLAVAVVDAMSESEAGVPLALAADAVLLTATLGVADLAGARRTLGLLGPQRVLGCVAIRRAGAR